MRALGPVLLAYPETRGELRARCGETLLRLLPRVVPGDHVLLDGDMRAAMRRVLGEAICTDSRLCITILNAMRVIGDDKALDAVETLLGMRPVGRVHARVLECARQAMPDIRIRAAEVRRSETLLRPADPSDEATLLRPADGAPSGDEERLVRPAEQATANSGQAPRG